MVLYFLTMPLIGMILSFFSLWMFEKKITKFQVGGNLLLLITFLSVLYDLFLVGANINIHFKACLNTFLNSNFDMEMFITFFISPFIYTWGVSSLDSYKGSKMTLIGFILCVLLPIIFVFLFRLSTSICHYFISSLFFLFSLYLIVYCVLELFGIKNAITKTPLIVFFILFSVFLYMVFLKL